MNLSTVVTDTIAELDGAGVPNVTLDAGTLNLPGVLVQLEAVTPDLLGGHTLRLRCLLIVGDTTPGRAMAALSTLYDAMLAAAGRPVAPVTALTISLPENPTPMPALAFALDVIAPD